MTVIELPDEQAAALKARARAQGLTLEGWFQKLAEEDALAGQSPVDSDQRPIWEVIADNMKNVPLEDLALLPKDGASQIDHYVYGHPKKDK